ncbi:MAG TPA: hypothetical protein VHA06_23240 [Candidatus Angelobacter sp.]|jgi:hypothetical protein|nr:hypothetical protein [Candidatus Angelobacter sp.]
MRKVILCAFAFLIFSVTFLSAAQPQQPAQAQPTAQTQPSGDVPVTDGASGDCSIDFNVTDSEGKPVYAARIDVHLAYGFAGAHKLDMGVYTNAEGKARFTGIPLRVRKPPIEFRAKKDDLIGLATMDPLAECHARHDIVLAKEKP